MKKTLLTFSVLSAIICCTLAYASKGQGSLAHFDNTSASVDESKPVVAKVENRSQVPNAPQGMKINEEAILRATSRVATTNVQSAAKAASRQSNVEEIVVDLWNNAPQIFFSDGSTFDQASNTITFPGSAEQSNQIFTGIDESGSYEWYAVKGQTYQFCGTLTGDSTATVYPCILYADGSSYYIRSSATIVLEEANNYTSEFNVSASGISENAPLAVAFIVENSSTTTTISSTNNRFFYSYNSSVAQEWTSANDLPGLGLSNFGSDAYTVLCEDGISTLGLYYNGNLYVTGINTTASEVNFPQNITINGVVEQIDFLGLNDTMDWSGAPNLTHLNVGPTNRINIGFENSPVTDLYIGQNCSLMGNKAGNSNIYLHIPYGVNRNNYSGYGFKRVLVGDEQPDYPVPSYSSWVIAGENEGDYFGISFIDGSYRIVEIFTEKESVVLPDATPDYDGLYYIRCIGSDISNYGKLCINSTALKSVTIPATYNYVRINWSYNPITDLHMMGNVPNTSWSLSSNMNVYVANQSYFTGYENNSNWNKANILPDGWTFEWMTVNVGRKGEFAQTYIEMTDADWAFGMYVKITGTLNETDLANIKKLTSLRKLDLSEAEFTALPASFLEDKSSLIEVILPEHLTSIPQYAFQNCTKLSKVTAPGLTSIGQYAFQSCCNLSDFDITKVRTISQYAFDTCIQYNPGAFSSELKTIGSYAFYNTALQELVIPEGVTTISSYAFSYCSRLGKITLPNTITLIKDGAFSRCGNLISINLLEGITSIGNDAFEGCSHLPEITLPSTLQTIGNDVFDGCTSLVSVKCKAIVPPVSNGVFTDGVDLNHCTLYIAPFAIDAYRAAQDWNNFYIMKSLNEPVKNIYINRPMTFDLLSEDNAVLQENPNMTLNYGSGNVGQLSASGDGTLSAGIFTIFHKFQRRYNSGSTDYRTTLINNAENMRADSVLCSINFEKNRWHFISFQYDVQMADIFGLNNTDFVIRQYNGENRASGDGTVSNWENVPADGVLKAGKGYIIQAANNTTDADGYSYYAIVKFPSRNTVTKNNLFTSNNVIVPLEEYPAEFAHNRSWNLVGNPYPCYYDMHYLMDDFSTPIVLWRGTNYQAYSPIDDDIILRPNEAFFVQRPLDAEQMVFGADGRMHYGQAYDRTYNSDLTPGIYSASSASCSTSKRSVFNFTIEGCDTDDRARIVMNEEALMDYEINRDATKFFAETSEGAEIYVDGNVKYDICERPFADGIATLGTRIGTKGEYTISLSGRNIDGWTVMLTDTQTGTTVNLNEGAYSFDAETGTTTGRFIVSFKAPEHSAIDDINVSTENSSVRVVNVAGITVFEGNINDFKDSAAAGVYVVIDSEKAYKIVVK